MNVKLEIPKDELATFLTYLGLGTLCAIKNGAVPPQVGIWTLAQPNLLAFLNNQPSIPKGLIEVFRQADELSAIDKLLPGQFDAEVEKLMKTLEAELKTMAVKAWSIKTD